MTIRIDTKRKVVEIISADSIKEVYDFLKDKGLDDYRISIIENRGKLVNNDYINRGEIPSMELSPFQEGLQQKPYYVGIPNQTY